VTAKILRIDILPYHNDMGRAGSGCVKRLNKTGILELDPGFFLFNMTNGVYLCMFMDHKWF